jgi:hypothetical protein
MEETAALVEEYITAMRQMTLEEHVAELMRYGIPIQAIATVCPAPMKIVLDKSGQLYQPVETGLLAWTFPVCCADPEDPDAIETPDPLMAVATGPVIDLLAFSPSAPGRWALRRGIATVVGAIEPQYLDPVPVPVHRDVTDWLRADCRGIVLLTSHRIEVVRLLHQCRAIEAEDAAHAAELRRILAGPPPKLPPIRVGAPRRSAA